MKLKLLTCVVILLSVSQAYAQENTVLKTQKEKMSYIVGRGMGMNLKNQSIDVDLNILIKGLEDALAGKNSLLTDRESEEVIAAVRKEVLAKREELSKKNMAGGEAFLAKNKKKKGVKTLPSGLQYKVLQEGSGKTPSLNDTVTVNYQGTLLDGTEFDSSYKRGQPATFPLTRIIPGWREALPLMQEGSKWQLFVPPNLGYGEQGIGKVGPNAVLIFEIELISVAESKIEKNPAPVPKNNLKSQPEKN